MKDEHWLGHAFLLFDYPEGISAHFLSFPSSTILFSPSSLHLSLIVLHPTDDSMPTFYPLSFSPSPVSLFSLALSP